MLIPTEQGDLLQFGMITKHTRGEEIDGKKLENCNSYIFYLKRRENGKNKNQNHSQHQVFHQNIRHNFT